MNMMMDLKERRDWEEEEKEWEEEECGRRRV
jgi:hypothetical protein